MHYRNLRKHYKPILFFGAMALMFLLIFLGSTFTPLMMDDYMYSFVYGMDALSRVDSIADIIQSMQTHYFAWGGRVTVHSVVQLLLWWDKIIFNVLNAAVYVLLSYIIYRFAGTEKYDFKCYAAILIAMWFWIPMFGETVFWLSGSINYLWNVTFNLCWLFQFKKQLDAPHATSRLFQIWFCIASVLVGSISENVSFACLLVAVLFVVQMKVAKQAVARWMYISLALSFAGWLFLVSAPGNYVRSDLVTGGSTSLWTLYDRFVYLCAGLNYACFGTIALFLVLFTLAIYQKAPLQTIFSSLALVLGAVASQYSLIAAATFQERAMMGTQMLLFVACAVLYRQIRIDPYRLIGTVGISIACVALAFNLILVMDVLLYKSIDSNKRDQCVVDAVAAGETEITIWRIYADVPYSVFDTSITELSSESSFWINQYYAAYWGADSVSAIG